VTDTFILKGINGASIGNAVVCHVRGVSDRTTGICIFTEKAPIGTIISKLRVLKFQYLKNNKLYESGNASKGLFPLERFAARKAVSRAVFTGNGHCRCSFKWLKPSSMSIACENYHCGGFRRGKTL
jgi:hypothetical protein